MRWEENDKNSSNALTDAIVIKCYDNFLRGQELILWIQFTPVVFDPASI